MFHHQRGRNWLLNRTKYQEFHVHYVVQSFHTGASLYLLRRCVWEYVPVSFLCLCCRWIGRCQCFVYFSTYQWNKKNLNETFGKFLKSSLFTLLSLAVYYVIYLLSGDHGSRCNKRYRRALDVCAEAAVARSFLCDSSRCARASCFHMSDPVHSSWMWLLHHTEQFTEPATRHKRVMT